ncbi:vomeronasal 1 receptor cavPorV1R622 [Cavia porcellus]|uniref:vomeronasal 1 receptor cavPorV1R622 n=1 Tax=Cavia porcellus TaxID=10141 RepID=UPI0001CF740C|nr:vomeronasal 1 receptor cavPorV1R622 [Cavia porcellus]
MTSVDLKFFTLLLFPICIGSLGNLSLLCQYVFIYFSGSRSRPTDFILTNLTVANLLVILSRGIPDTMSALGMKDFLNNFGCKLVFYVLMVGKGVSFSTTCLLSVFQAITISPRSTRWAELKVKALKYIGHCTILFWVLHMLANIRVPMLVSEKSNNENLTNTIDYQYCSATTTPKDKNTIFASLSLSHDILCLKFMIWSSGSMVFILYRHKQRTKHIHRYNSSSRTSPETRASQSIFILVCAFVSFYALSSITYIWFSIYDRSAWWLVKTSALTNACFPTASPFILMTREHCVCRCMWKK